MSTKRSERILGPWEQRGGWRVMIVHADNTRTTRLLATEDKARRYIDAMGAALAIEERTTATALVEYTAHLAEKGDKPASIEVTRWAIVHMFPDESALRSLNAKRCAALYDELRTRPSARTGRPLAADTHRNVLAQAKSFLRWCVKRRWLAANPLVDVEGIGKRRPRGKSLGKAGNELRVKQARAWYRKALELAIAGDRGATAGLVALLLGMRASEIVSRRAGDLDEDAAPGDLLWIAPPGACQCVGRADSPSGASIGSVSRAMLGVPLTSELDHFTRLRVSAACPWSRGSRRLRSRFGGDAHHGATGAVQQGVRSRDRSRRRLQHLHLRRGQR